MNSTTPCCATRRLGKAWALRSLTSSPSCCHQPARIGATTTAPRCSADSLATAVRSLSARFGDDPAAWRWGDAHQAVFAHPILRNIPLLGSFTTISIPSPGDDDTLDRGGMNALLQSVQGAAYRGVYDLADLDRSLFMITPGQSGNPFSTPRERFCHALARRCYHPTRPSRGQYQRNGPIDAMSYGAPYLDDEFLAGGVLSRRCVAWVIDVILIAILVAILWSILAMFGVLTFGLGFAAMGVLPFVPFCYHLLSLLGPASATPGQRMLGLTVRRNFDLGPPTGLQALVSTLAFYLTLATSGLLLVVALFTIRHRTLHDLVSGLVVVRVRAMQALTAPREHWNMRGGTPAP